MSHNACFSPFNHGQNGVDPTFWSPIVMRGLDFLTCLCVPEFDVPVVPTAEELLPRVVEGDVPHCLLMTTVGTYAPPLIVYFPDLEKI